MIDGIKLSIKSKDYANKLQENELFEFVSNYNNSTYELSLNVIAEYKNLTINIYESGKVVIKGSLHKFWNNGIHNYNDFHLTNVLNIVDEWVDLFGTEILNAKIDNIEFGVNIKPPIQTAEILRNVLLHKRVEFKTGTFKNSNYKECEHKHFYIKIYDKALQYNQLENNLRIECKYIRMVELNRLGIYSFKDLRKLEIYPELECILIKKWNEVLFIDETIKRKGLKEKQRDSLNNYLNPNYWLKIAKNETYKYNKEEIKYKNIVSKFSDNLQFQISNLINEKWQKLTENFKIEKKELAKINHSYIGLNIAKTSKSCLITGLPIDMQKEESKFLCTTGVEYYFNNHKDLYFELLYPRLSKRWYNSDQKKQFTEIAHSIRNEYYNPIHNKDRIENKIRNTVYKLLETPSLFDNRLLIAKDKLKIANIYINKTELNIFYNDKTTRYAKR